MLGGASSKKILKELTYKFWLAVWHLQNRSSHYLASVVAIGTVVRAEKGGRLSPLWLGKHQRNEGVDVTLPLKGNCKDSKTSQGLQLLRFCHLPAVPPQSQSCNTSSSESINIPTVAQRLVQKFIKLGLSSNIHCLLARYRHASEWGFPHFFSRPIFFSA